MADRLLKSQQLGAWLSTALLLVGCADYTQLSYRVDKRIAFTTPKAHSLATLPLSLKWVDHKAASEETYVLFVDRPPIKPGHTLHDVARGDASCQQDPQCPTTQYLNDRGVFVTHQTHLTLDDVPPLANSQSIQIHDVILVVLNSSGQRIGEVAWHVEFQLRKRSFR